MKQLKSKLYEILAPHFHDKHDYIYLDLPIHNNVGDLLIYLGTEAYFSDRNIRPILKRGLVKKIENIPTLNEKNIIVLHGGGNLGDIWYEHEDFRLKIIEKYKHNKIIILPQSIHFNDPKMAARTASVYSAHPDLTLFVRDTVSQKYAQDVLGVQAILCPDMAYALVGHNWLPKPLPHTAIMKFWRLDKEASPLGRGEGGVDWKNILTLYQRLMIRIMVTVSEKYQSNWFIAIWLILSRQIVWHCAKYFNKFGVVETDRLHAMILGTLLAKEVILHDNSYGKLSRYRDAWLKGIVK